MPISREQLKTLRQKLADGFSHHKAITKTGRIKGVADKADRTADGIVFASKREMMRYCDLVVLRGAGAVLWFLRQTPFHLPGGVKYVADFVVFWRDGRVSVEDVKGFKTEVYRLKKKQVEATYPITIEEL